MNSNKHETKTVQKRFKKDKISVQFILLLFLINCHCFRENKVSQSKRKEIIFFGSLLKIKEDNFIKVYKAIKKE